jgi:hypothetical protein
MIGRTPPYGYGQPGTLAPGGPPGLGQYGQSGGGDGQGAYGGQGTYGQGVYDQGAYGGQGMYGDGAYGQGAYAGQGMYGDGVYGQGAYGGQGMYGQGAYGQGAYGGQGTYGTGAYGGQGPYEDQGAYGAQGTPGPYGRPGVYGPRPGRAGSVQAGVPRPQRDILLRGPITRLDPAKGVVTVDRQSFEVPPGALRGLSRGDQVVVHALEVDGQPLVLSIRRQEGFFPAFDAQRRRAPPDQGDQMLRGTIGRTGLIGQGAGRQVTELTTEDGQQVLLDFGDRRIEDLGLSPGAGVVVVGRSGQRGQTQVFSVEEVRPDPGAPSRGGQAR